MLQQNKQISQQTLCDADTYRLYLIATHCLAFLTHFIMVLLEYLYLPFLKARVLSECTYSDYFGYQFYLFIGFQCISIYVDITGIFYIKQRDEISNYEERQKLKDCFYLVITFYMLVFTKFVFANCSAMTTGAKLKVFLLFICFFSALEGGLFLLRLNISRQLSEIHKDIRNPSIKYIAESEDEDTSNLLI